MSDARNERIVVLLLDGLAGCEGERSHGSSMKSSEKGQVELSAGVPPGQFESRFHSFGSGIAEVDLAASVHWGEQGKFLSQQNLGGVVEIRTRHVQE